MAKESTVEESAKVAAAIIQSHMTHFSKLNQANKLATSLPGFINTNPHKAYQTSLQLQQELKCWQDEYPNIEHVLPQVEGLITEIGWLWVKS